MDLRFRIWYASSSSRKHKKKSIPPEKVISYFSICLGMTTMWCPPSHKLVKIPPLPIEMLSISHSFPSHIYRLKSLRIVAVSTIYSINQCQPYTSWFLSWFPSHILYRLKSAGWWFGTWILLFPSYWEFHHPNWRTPWFFRGVGIPPIRFRCIL